MIKQLALTTTILALAIAASYAGYLIATPPASTIEFNAPAVSEDGRGVMIPFKLSIKPGEGRLLVNIAQTSFKADVENSLRKAKANAEKFMSVSLQHADLIVEAQPQQKIVGGESAGAAFTIAIISLYSGHALNNQATVSATINENGDIGEVDGIEEKIIAAREAGKTTFVVSKQQKIKSEESLRHLGIQIIRASNITEAAQHLLS
ncbi:MAG: S16 family serine protease [Candidatus Micrarchaeia archaeon]